MKKIFTIKRSSIFKITKIVIVVFIFITLISSSTISIKTNIIDVNKIQKNNLKLPNDSISNGLAPRSKSLVREATDVKSAPVTAPDSVDYTYMYGYNANPGPEETFFFPIDDPAEYNYLGETISGDFLAGGTFGCDEVWYGVQYGNGLLYGIDTYTGDMWSIGGGGTGINGLAYSPIYNRMYGSSDSNYLYEIDPDTGEQDIIGAFGSGVQYMIGMAFDSDGVLYGWDLGNDALWTIDIETAEAAQVGPLGININYAQDGDFCRENDNLYLTAYTSTGQLYECDEDTGACTLIGAIGSGVQTTASIFINSCCCIEHDVTVKSIDAPVSGCAEPDMDMIITVKNTGDNTETFDAQMEIIKCESGPLIFEEYFDDCVMPDGWETDYWTVENSSYAGGQSCEARCYCYDQYVEGDYYDNYIQSPPIDCKGAEKVNLRFRWGGDYLYPQYGNVYVKFRRNSTSPWKDVTPWENPVGSNQDGELYEIGCYSFGEPMGEEFQVRWEYIGYYYYFNYLYLDDITVEACGSCAEYAELVESITLAPGVETQVSFPGWTPSEWQNESSENTWVEYPVHAFVILEGDHNPRNDEKWILIDLWYPWLHDIEVMSINSPYDPEGESLPAQTFPVAATMRNVGQFAECCIPIDVNIGEPVLLGTLKSEYDWPGYYNPYGSGYQTYFPGYDTGWRDDHKSISYYYGWRRYYGSYSGGSPYEAYILYYYCYQDYHFYNGPIDASGYQMLRLRFLSNINHYYGQGLYSLEAGYSFDGKTFYAAWHEEPSSSGKYEVDVPIAGGADTLYIGFWVKGNPYYFNYWYIDNVELVAMGFSEEYYDFACQGPDLEPGDETTFTFEDWTPTFLAEETTGSKDYIVKSSIELEGDKNSGNDIKTEEISLDFWWDVGIHEITSPVGEGNPREEYDTLWDNGEPDGKNALAGGMYLGYSNILIDDFENGEDWFVQGGSVHFIWGNGYTGNTETIRMYFFADEEDCDPSLDEYPEPDYVFEAIEFTEYTTGNYYFSCPEVVVNFLLEEEALIPSGKWFVGIQPDGIIEDIAYILTAESKGCMCFADLPYWGHQRWSSSQYLWGLEYDLAFEVHGGIPCGGGRPDVYIQPGIEDIDVIVMNYGTFPKEDLICSVEIYDYSYDPDGTQVYAEQIDNIDLTIPLGGQEELNFPDFTFANEGRCYMYVDFPAEPDDKKRNNKEVWVVYVDGTRPKCAYPPIFDPEEPNGCEGWYVNDVTVTLNATDPWSNGVSSGVREIRYTVNGGEEKVLPGKTGSFVLTEDGDDILVQYWCIDYVGNVEATKNSFTIDIDQTEPDVALTYEVTSGNPLQGWEFTFTATASDAMSGMWKVEFYFNDVLQETVVGSGPEYSWSLMYWPIPDATIKALAYDIACLTAYDEVKDPIVSSSKQFINKQIPNNEYNTLKTPNLK